MLHRSRSKDNYAPPGGSLMSKGQMKDYLQELRTNRPTRPQGSRPPPASMKRRSYNFDFQSENHGSLSSESENHDLPSRSSSALSFHRHNYSMSGRASPEKLIYAERDHRRQEREEARQVRKAMEHGSAEEEQHVLESARQEADHLISKQETPHAPYHTSKASRTSLNRRCRQSASIGGDGDYGDIFDEYDRGSVDAPREAADVLTKAVEEAALNSQNQSQSLEELEKDMSRIAPIHEAKQDHEEQARGIRRISQRLSLNRGSHRRRSSGMQYSTAPTQSKKGFPNEREKIHEDPPSPTKEMTAPAIKAAEPSTNEPSWVRRNPFARAQGIRHSLTRRTSRQNVKPEVSESQRTASKGRNQQSPARPAQTGSDDTQSSDARYKNGVEVRSDDIRAATSMRMSDRSPRLPSPTVVSDNPGRPIVSFNKDWRPQENDVAQSNGTSRVGQRPAAIPYRPSSRGSMQDHRAATDPAVPTTHYPAPPRIHVGQTSGWRDTAPSISSDIPRVSVNSIPSISVAEDFSSSSSVRPVPSINVSDDPRSTSLSSRPVPTISVSDIPSISVQGPKIGGSAAVPTISVSNDTPSEIPNSRSGNVRDGTRPRQQTRPAARHTESAPATSRPDWAHSGRRQNILCAQCATPIVGRIVSAAGTRFHPQCFTCYHCNEALECVAFLPEPAEQRSARLERIDRRAEGEDVAPPDGFSVEQDSDDSLRFYCHLDYHEFFSPRCKSCKTPIEGEIVVACGAHWHVGHFFCAECGDPFDHSRPFIERDGYAWCVDCHTRRTSTRCAKCRKPVTDTVVSALGAEWHEGCFTCVECGGPFAEGKYFVRSSGGGGGGGSKEPVCFGCEARRLKA